MDVDTVISTSPDQIAIAPGSLVREWQENGRRYFDYKLDHPVPAFFSFMSARYEVQREEWNGIKLEVYYDTDHPWNVPRMMNSLQEIARLLHAKLRPLLPQRSAHHRVPARGAVCPSLSPAPCRIRSRSASSPT